MTRIEKLETKFQAGDVTLKAFVARPKDDESNSDRKYPGVVVIHEILGLTKNIRDTTIRFAENGYAAIAVDLFSGGNAIICIAQTMAAVFADDTNNLGTQRLKSAVDFFAEQPFVDASNLGAIGFCLGGNFAIALACEDKRLKTIAPFYSTNPSFKKIDQVCPVVGSFPALDPTAGAASVLKQKLEECGVENDIKVYPNTIHSFMSDDIPITYNKAASEDAWERTLTFFAKHLKTE